MRSSRRWNIVGVFATLLLAHPAVLQSAQESTMAPLSGINRSWLGEDQGTSQWGRNPFEYPRTPEQTQVRNLDGTEGPLQLNAILYHEEGSVAIINHHIVRAGDRIGGKKVLSILSNRVLLQDLSGVQELKLESFGIR